QACSSRSPGRASRTNDLLRFKEIISTSSSWRRIRIEIRFRSPYLCLDRCLLSHAPDLPSRPRNGKPFLHLASHLILFASCFNQQTHYFLFSAFWLFPRP